MDVRLTGGFDKQEGGADGERNIRLMGGGTRGHDKQFRARC